MIDLDAAYIRGCQILHVPRGDEALPHLGGDVAGLCDRESWARRKGEKLAPFDPETLTAFELGHAAEKLLLDRIEAGLPPEWVMWRNTRIALSLHHGQLRCRMEDAGSFKEPTSEELVGHIDAYFFQKDSPATSLVVVDTKSGVWDTKFEGGKKLWFKKWPTKHSHKLQVAAYCMGLQLIQPFRDVMGKLYELDLGGKAREETTVDVEALRSEVLMRMAEVLERTNPNAPEPPAEPNHWTIRPDGTSWACGSVKNGVVSKGYCRYTKCPKHVANVEVEL